jgi:hypothetical protein
VIRILAVVLAAGALCLHSVGADTDAVAVVADVIPVLTLKGGRVLHAVKVMSDEPDSLVVKADEGLIKVRKADLPAIVAAHYPVRDATPDTYIAPFSLAPPAGAPTPAPRPAPKPVRKTAKAAEPSPIFKGCTILSFEPKPFQTVLGAADVRIHNDTDAPVEILPHDLECVSADGTHLRGRFLVMVPDVGAAVVKRKDFVPAHGDLTDRIVFSNDAVVISELHWGRP